MPNPDATRQEEHAIGGQAVLEGVMMRNPQRWAVAVRRPDGGIHTESHPVPGGGKRTLPRRTPFVRGAVALGDTMSIAVRALAISARESAGEREEEIGPRQIASALTFAFGFFIVLFIVAPALVVRGGEPVLQRNLLDGVVRLAVFFGYIAAIARMRETSRLFAYHGAEHKVIAAREAGAPATRDGVRPFSTIHVRCGTNFLFMLMVVSLVAFLIAAREPWYWRIGSRVLLLPVVAGLTYEILRLSARFPHRAVVRAISWPGLRLQRVTTKEPSDEQVDVALASLRELLGEGPPSEPEPRDPSGPDVA